MEALEGVEVEVGNAKMLWYNTYTMADILIIEDDKFLSKIYSTKFEKLGIPTDLAVNGQIGLAKMKEDPPKLILLDLIMPKVDGFDVLEEMNKDKKLEDIPVLVLSNLGQESDIERAKKLGAKEFIVKSDTSIADVVTKIQSHLK